jgi:hypothetical protein
MDLIGKENVLNTNIIFKNIVIKKKVNVLIKVALN